MMNKEDETTADMQTRLVTDDALNSTQEYPETDEEQQNLTFIQVADQVHRGEKQPPQFRDVPFAVLFVVHLLTILYFAFAWGLPAARKSSNDYPNPEDDTVANMSVSGVVGLLALSSLGGLLIVSGVMAFMIKFAEQLIQISLIFSIFLSLVFAVGFAMENLIWMSVLYFIVFGTGVCYAYFVWRRIPFARANLVTAITAVKTNLGVTAVAFGMLLLFVVWSVLWSLSYLGIYMHSMHHCEKDDCQNPTAGVVGVFFLLSFYWTSEVIKNVLHVTTAGVVGTWFLVPDEASSFCSSAITDSFSRAVTYSFGSICMGSLLIAIIRSLRYLIHQARSSNQRNALLLCILECLVACLEGLVEYFNKFAFIYVGLYGYDFVTSGRKVLQLFQDRGWTTIINDNLVYRVLMLMCLVVGGLTGCIGMLLAYLLPGWVDAFGDDKYIFAFFLPFLIGTAMAHVVFGVVASATDTVIVCFAESPNDFQSNHPQLSHEMLNAWRQIYPNEFGL